MSNEPYLRRRPASILSPLRYPGGKRRLAGYIAEALRLSDLCPELYVEPFAGGASVGIQLLNDGLVGRLILGEKDPLVAAFWQVVFSDHEWLVRRVEKMEPSLAQWDHLRKSRPRSPRRRALKCLYLNRTSFSGILNDSAGPIGGRSQQSPYDIGCRFAKEAVIRRIKQIAALADRVEVYEGDWEALVDKVEQRGLRKEEVFYYLDPPFYFKADRLYRFFFDDPEHRRLHDRLGSLHGHYLLSYDVAAPIQALYTENGIGPKRVELLYSAMQGDRLVRAQELIVSNLPELPQASRLWLSSSEWRG